VSLFVVISSLLLTADPAPPIVALAVTSEGNQILTGSQSGVRILSLPGLQQGSTVATQLGHVHDLAFSPRGDLLAVAGGSPAERGSVELWQWPAGKLLATLSAGGDVVYRVAWSPDGSRLAAAGGDRKVRILSKGGGEAKTLVPHSAAVLSIAWLAGDDLLLSAGVDQSIRVLSPLSGEVVRSLDNHTAAVRDLAIQPGQSSPPLVASCGADRTVRFWQPTIGRLVRFVRLPSSPTAIVWSCGGSHILAACEDGRLRAIDPATLRVIEFAARLEGRAHAVAALPDGSAAILAGERGQLRSVPLDAIKP
jgi:WD40 repeat protein